MNNYVLTVGMEIHVELETKTKMFCCCPNDPFFAKPNVNVCPVCYGLPGALPVVNKEAVKNVIKFGQAIKADIAKHTLWARKNYFYPDLPKGYQISQSTEPLIIGGQIVIGGETYHLNHAHLEEDAGKLMHAPDKTGSLINLNRAGVPLLEIVTQPDFHSASAAKEFCQELQRIMRDLNISSADMEKGRMRCEANISVSKDETLGTKVEVKNINSFRAVEKAIEYEFARQTSVLEAGEKLHQETRNWDEPSGKTVVMRSKETSADYRYFPEPDLPPVIIDGLEEFAGHVLPEEKRSKLAELGFHKELIQSIIDKNGYDTVIELAETDRDMAVEAGKLYLAIPDFAALPLVAKRAVIKVKQENGFSTDVQKKLISQANEQNVPIESLVSQTESFCLEAAIQEVIAENADAVATYKAGKEAVFQFLVGQVMAKTKGMANIQEVRTQLQENIFNFKY